jgi:hypothetical protein
VNRTDKVDFAQAFLAAALPRPQRLVMTACMALADADGFLEVDVALLAPMSGYRRMHIRASVDSLILQGWLYAVGDNKVKLTYGEGPPPGD